MPEKRSPASRARRPTRRGSGNGPVLVWSEAGVTVAVSDDPPQFVRFTTGHERFAPDDSPASIQETEQKVFEACEAIVEKRVEKLMRLVRDVRKKEAPRKVRVRGRRASGYS